MSFLEYLRQVQQQRQSNRATEPSYYDALKGLLLSLDSGIAVTIQPAHTLAGAPDLVVTRGDAVVGYVEAKDLNAPLDEVERSEQLQRYRRSLSNLLLTDFLEFRRYQDGEPRETARLGNLGPRGDVIHNRPGTAAVRSLLAAFLSHDPGPITDSAELASRLAKLAHMIQDTVREAFERGEASPLLVDLRNSFADTLLPGLREPENVGQFADMYAQTIAYGLFAAAVQRKEASGPFRRRDAAHEIPPTNPFLRRLFEIIAGTQMDNEPYAPFVDDLVHLLERADMARVLEHFARRTGQDDAVVHFYETFLQQYDPRLREMRGVYYTPAPVVSYIVRSVDRLLQERFGLPDGLADSATVPYQVADSSGAPPRKATKTAHRVLVLDPACGTGTFLYEAVDLIRERFRERGNAGMWSGYVRDHLLPRLFGFELLMAPYAVAHLKLGMQLAGLDLEGDRQQAAWAYDFAADERLRVYLTNTLEEAEERIVGLWGPLRVISQEANAAAEVKRDLPIMAIMGNPPYSGHSANKGKWIDGLLKGRLPDGTVVPSYYLVDGRPLGERNPKWLQDDYVKFIRWAQWRIERTGAGILAFISNHGYLDNPTFRGMRQALMNAFTDIYVLDLHGNAKKREVSPDGSPDQNVFDIQQGVAIGIFVKEPGREGPATVHHAGLWGTREAKYAALAESDAAETEWQTVEPRSPFYLFVPQDVDLLAEYQRGWKLPDALPVNSVGIVTARDSLTIHFTAEDAWRTVTEFAALLDEPAREKFRLGPDVRDWKVALAQQDVRTSGPKQSRVVPVLYRPFDVRHTYYTGRTRGFICMPRPEVMRHMLAGPNLAIGTTRSTEIGRGWEHLLCTRHMIQHHTVSIKEVNYLFPLYLYPERQTQGNQRALPQPSHWPAGPGGRTPNLDPAFVRDLEQRLGLAFVPDGRGDLVETFGPEDVFHYLYAVLHSPTYRERYAQFLKIDFPRVPLTSDVGLFRELCRLGAELTALHLLESPALARPFTSFPAAGSNEVARGFPKYVAPGEPAPAGSPPEMGRVYINPAQHFENVPPEVWEFHVGGYQVAEKWLKDRRGRALTYDDLQHYRKVVLALRETVRLMEEIDDAVPAWPVG